MSRQSAAQERVDHAVGGWDYIEKFEVPWRNRSEPDRAPAEGKDGVEPAQGVDYDNRTGVQ
ncbi:MAG: hypothetical protein HW408_277, partial [Actinobacteria bacterium]|nr:hypothetical protein [Actinomycetota bacterium]